nr:retrovirus-related Pol polyprotein from transposon TNT 1-94 [Tanacetum cinerariifolium]
MSKTTEGQEPKGFRRSHPRKTPYELLRGRKPTIDYFKVFGSKCFSPNTKDYLTKFDPKSYEGVFLGYSQNSKACIILNKHIIKVKESLNVTFDETHSLSKTSLLVDDDLDKEEAVKVTEKKNIENDIKDKTLEVDEIVNIKESKNHPLENVIGNLNQRTLRSQAQNQSNFFCFIKAIEPKNVNKALKDESWIVKMIEKLSQFIANDVWQLVPHPKSTKIIGTKWVYRNKLDENAIVSHNKASSNSVVSTALNCSSSCLENVKILKEQNKQLLKDLRTSKIQAITYKTGLESVEARLLVYKKNKSVYEEDIKLLKRNIHLREVAIIELRRKLELAKKQKVEIQLRVETFDKFTKNLSKLIDCQILDKFITGLGYNDVPPPYTGNFLPPKPYLSCLEEFVNEPIVSEPTIKKPIVETSEGKASADKPKAVKKNFGPPLIEDWISDSEDEAESKYKIEKETVKPSFAKIKFVKSKEQVKSPRKTTVKQ